MPSKVKLAIMAAVILAVVMVVMRNQADGLASITTNSQGQATNGAPLAALPAQAGSGNPANAVGSLSAEQLAQQQAQLRQQLALAQHTLNSYQAATRYPHESRPISEHPDQVYPNKPVEDTQALHKTDGKVNPDIKIRTTQNHVFIANKESVSFTIAALDASGNRLPIFVNRAVARGVVANGQRPTADVTVNFADDGQNGDGDAGDGIYGATLTPSATGFANFNGTVRMEVNFNVGDSQGFVNFDFIYTPETPATWTGAIRDVAENGSLSFYLKANVNQRGRYVISARVDDASGKPFALLMFNDILSTGPQEVKLPLFGKLILDQNPSFPLKLRDVDGYLLKEDTDPDRALMPRLAGTVYSSKKYPANVFSNAEWSSEERTRYLNEYTNDVKQAQAALNGGKAN